MPALTKQTINEERLMDIEIKLSYQDKTIKDLNDVVCEQQKEIEKLNSICENLINTNKEYAQVVSGTNAPANEKPPHY